MGAAPAASARQDPGRWVEVPADPHDRKRGNAPVAAQPAIRSREVRSNSCTGFLCCSFVGRCVCCRATDAALAIRLRLSLLVFSSSAKACCPQDIGKGELADGKEKVADVLQDQLVRNSRFGKVFGSWELSSGGLVRWTATFRCRGRGRSA